MDRSLRLNSSLGPLSLSQLAFKTTYTLGLTFSHFPLSQHTSFLLLKATITMAGQTAANTSASLTLCPLLFVMGLGLVMNNFTGVSFSSTQICIRLKSDK